MLSYSTGESGTGADVEKVRAATALVRARAPDLPVEGPIQYDAAVDAAVAATKLPDSEVAGRATVFIFPDLNTGNNTYKAVQRSAGAVAVGPVLQGLRKPVNDLSRGALGAGHRQHGGDHRDPGANARPTGRGSESRPRRQHAARRRSSTSSSTSTTRADARQRPRRADRRGQRASPGTRPRSLRRRSRRSSGTSTANSRPDHTAAFAVMLEAFAAHGPDLDSNPPVAVGHRVVHGGDRFARADARSTTRCKRHIDELSALAPLHNPPNLAGIVAAQAAFPDVPQVAVFDTAFHQTLPPAAYTYAIDARAGRRSTASGATASTARRSQFVSDAAAALLGRPVADLKLIVLHLGNGASRLRRRRRRVGRHLDGPDPARGPGDGHPLRRHRPGVLVHLHRERRDWASTRSTTCSTSTAACSGSPATTTCARCRPPPTPGTPAAAARLRRVPAPDPALRRRLPARSSAASTRSCSPPGSARTTPACGPARSPAWSASASGSTRRATTRRPGTRASSPRDDSPIAVLVVPTNEELEIARQTLAVASGSRQPLER